MLMLCMNISLLITNCADQNPHLSLVPCIGKISLLLKVIMVLQLMLLPSVWSFRRQQYILCILIFSSFFFHLCNAAVAVNINVCDYVSSFVCLRNIFVPRLYMWLYRVFEGESLSLVPFVVDYNVHIVFVSSIILSLCLF